MVSECWRISTINALPLSAERKWPVTEVYITSGYLYVSLLAMLTASIGIVKMFDFTLRYCGTTFVFLFSYLLFIRENSFNKCKGVKSNSPPFNATSGKNVNIFLNLLKTTNTYIFILSTITLNIINNNFNIFCRLYKHCMAFPSCNSGVEVCLHSCSFISQNNFVWRRFKYIEYTFSDRQVPKYYPSLEYYPSLSSCSCSKNLLYFD